MLDRFDIAGASTTVFLRRLRFSDLTTGGGDGGAIKVSYGASLSVVGSVFERTTAGTGGAIHADMNRDLYEPPPFGYPELAGIATEGFLAVRDSAFNSCDASLGAGIDIRGPVASFSLAGLTFADNTAGRGYSDAASNHPAQSSVRWADTEKAIDCNYNCNYNYYYPDQEANATFRGDPFSAQRWRAGHGAGADPCTGEYIVVPDDPSFRGDADGGQRWDDTSGNGGSRGPFGLGATAVAWYMLPAARGLAVAPPGYHRCGTGNGGWLSGWGDPEGVPDVHYATPFIAGTAMPVTATLCFNDPGDTCHSYTRVRAVDCGGFALWELSPTSDSDCGYCLAA